MSQKEIRKILEYYSSEMDENQRFFHILGEIGKHIEKLKILKENEDKPGHFNEEIADMYILGKLLLENEKISNAELENSLKHFLKKIREIYG